MDLTNKKPLIISAGIGGWYKAGVERLERSLIYNGWPGDMMLWKGNYPMNSPSHEDNPYAFKIYAFREAFRLGYTNVMWIDSSCWAIKNPIDIFDIIVDKGNFAFRSGYNCAETCTDVLLDRVGITRDTAETIPETATGLVGINYDNPQGKMVFDTWSMLCDEGYFKNSRNHNTLESLDPRFKHARQDQSAYSMALYMCGVEFNYIDYVSYYEQNNPMKNSDKAYFFIGGL